MSSSSSSLLTRKFNTNKKAVLIGLTYKSSPSTKSLPSDLDVYKVRNVCREVYSLPENNIITMLDTLEPGSKFYPTVANVKDVVWNMANSLIAQESLLVYFSCHGGRKEVDKETNNTAHKEYVVMADGVIGDDWFRNTTKRVRRPASFTVVADCCHSGGLIEGSKEQLGNSTWIGKPCHSVTPEQQAQYDLRRASKRELGIILCSCESFQLSKLFRNDNIHSCFTHAFSETLTEMKGLVSNLDLANSINGYLFKMPLSLKKSKKKRKNKHTFVGEVQQATLYCSDKHAKRLFFDGP